MRNIQGPQYPQQYNRIQPGQQQITQNRSPQNHQQPQIRTSTSGVTLKVPTNNANTITNTNGVNSINNMNTMNNINRSKNNDQVQQQIQQIKAFNNQLNNYSNNLNAILRTKPHNIVYGEFRNMFESMDQKISQLIENMQQFYIDMDKRVKGLALIILDNGNQLGNSRNINQKIDFIRQGLNHQTTYLRQSKSDNSERKYDQLSHKINSLEQSLQQTKHNQSKLIGVIQSLLHKYEVMEQPTFIKNNPNLRQYINEPSKNRPTRTIKNGSDQLDQVLLDESVVTSNLNQLKKKKIQNQRNHGGTFHQRQAAQSDNIGVFDGNNSSANQGRGVAVRSHTMHNKGLSLKGYKNEEQLQNNKTPQQNNANTQLKDRQRRMEYMMSKLHF